MSYEYLRLCVHFRNTDIPSSQLSHPTDNRRAAFYLHIENGNHATHRQFRTCCSHQLRWSFTFEAYRSQLGSQQGVRSLMNNFHFLHIFFLMCVLEAGEHHHEKWYIFKEITHNYRLLPLWKEQVSWNYWVKWPNLMNKEGTFKTPSLYPHSQWHFGQKVLQQKEKVFTAIFNEKTWQVKKSQPFHNYQN